MQQIVSKAKILTKVCYGIIVGLIVPCAMRVVVCFDNTTKEILSKVLQFFTEPFLNILIFKPLLLHFKDVLCNII